MHRQRLQPQPDRILTCRTACYGCQQRETGNGTVVKPPVLRPDRDQHIGDVRMPREGGDCVAQQGGVPEREVLLGQCVTEPSTSTGRDN